MEIEAGVPALRLGDGQRAAARGAAAPSGVSRMATSLRGQLGAADSPPALVTFPLPLQATSPTLPSGYPHPCREPPKTGDQASKALRAFKHYFVSNEQKRKACEAFLEEKRREHRIGLDA